MAARSKAQAFGRSPAEIVGLSIVSVVFCQVEVSATD